MSLDRPIVRPTELRSRQQCIESQCDASYDINDRLTSEALLTRGCSLISDSGASMTLIIKTCAEGLEVLPIECR